MIDNEQNVTAKSGRRGIMGIVLLFVLAGSLVGMVPVYMQNRIDRLYRTFDGLREKASLLNREILLRDYEINKLSSMDYLSKFAERAGLGLNEVPVKVMVTGESNE
jgi:cell division protein FtsL